jgi:trigger factor
VAVTREIARLDNSEVKLTFTYKNDDLREEYKKIVGDFAKNLQIKGFRKGKVPVSILENKLGKALREDALNAIIGNTVQDALKSEDFPADAVPLAYSEPVVEGEPELDLSGDLVFSVKYDVMPQFKLDKFEGLEIEVETAEVAEEDINRELEEIRERNAIVMDKDEGAPSEKGDVVTVNYAEISENGEVISGMEREDFTFILGGGHNIYKFDDEITGMKKDETREIRKTYPEDFEDKDLAGQTKKIRVKLTALKKRELPEDDELAQDVNEKFKNIGDLKQNIREQLEKELEVALKDLKIKKLFDKIIELNPISIPESMINAEIISIIRRMFAGYSVSDEELWKLVKSSALNEKYRESAVRDACEILIMDKLKSDFNVDISDNDIEEMYVDISKDTGLPVEDIKKEYAQEDKREYFNNEIKHKKTLALLLGKNTIKKGKTVNFLDIFQKNSRI